MRVAQRSIRVVPIIAIFLWTTLAASNSAQANALLMRKVGQWCLGQLASYAARKVIDHATGQDLHRQLEGEIPELITNIAGAIGPQRAALQESLDLHREQLAVLTRITSSNGQNIAVLKADQENLLRRIDSLAARMTKLERRVDAIDSHLAELDSRVSKLEDALIRECLDLRRASVIGADEFRVKEFPGGWIADRFESENLTLNVRLLLNSCTGDLTQRGLLLQLSLLTRDLKKDISLYVNFKGIGSGGQLGALSRQEIPLARPGYSVDGQVTEIFFPYDDIPSLYSSDRIALALVLTHDGEVLYTLPDRVLSCVADQRVNCRWGR